MPGPQDFMVGNAPTTRDFASPLLNFSQIANLPNDYMQGVDDQRKLALMRYFQENGIPRIQSGPNAGQIDLPTMMDKLVRYGGPSAAQGMIDLQMKGAIGQQLAAPLMPGGGTSPATSTQPQGTTDQAAPPTNPAHGPNAGPRNIDPNYQGGGGIETLTDNQPGSTPSQGPTLLSIAQQAYGQTPRAKTVADNLSKRYGIAPTDALDRNTAGRVASEIGAQFRSSGNALPSSFNNRFDASYAQRDPNNEDPAASGPGTQDTSAADRAMNGGNAAPLPSSGASGAGAPPAGAVSPAPMPAPARGATPQVPSELIPPEYRGNAQAAVQGLRDKAQRYDALGASYSLLNPESAKMYQDAATKAASQADKIVDWISKATEPTTAQKELNSAAALNEQAARQELFKKAGGEQGQDIADTIKGGGLAARQYLRTLDTMSDAFKQGGDNLFTGPHADLVLKVKQAVNNLVPDFFKGVPESEVIQKMNSYLASEAAKAMTQRPSQLEFKAFMAANPGLMNSEKGSQIMISILRQAKAQDIALGRLASNQRNWNNWEDVKDRFYNDPKNAIISPFTGKPISAADRVPGMQGAPVASTQGDGKGAPEVGRIVGNHRFKGGNPNDRNAWEAVR